MSIKNIYDLSEKELTELAFGPAKLTKKQLLEKKRKRQIAQKDKTYLDYPCIEIETGEIIGYPYIGYTKEEIEEEKRNPNFQFNLII
jgi:hypothetical protein